MPLPSLAQLGNPDSWITTSYNQIRNAQLFQSVFHRNCDQDFFYMLGMTTTRQFKLKALEPFRISDKGPVSRTTAGSNICSSGAKGISSLEHPSRSFVTAPFSSHCNEKVRPVCFAVARLIVPPLHRRDVTNSQKEVRKM